MTFGQLFKIMNPDVRIRKNGTCMRLYFDDVNYYTIGAEWWDKEIPDNAIAVLKEQEPILLENQHKPYGHSTSANSPWISRCPKCDKKIEGRQTRFCKYCGQAVTWE